MNYRRILTVQDVSCVGQCSLTVALPILSVCGLETAVLPSAVLSTHTGGFTGYTFRDLTEDMPQIAAHWAREGISFDAVYSGYLGNAQQAQYVRDIVRAQKRCTLIVDPAMADNGALYHGLPQELLQGMRELCAEADYILPNLTEACLLTGFPYRAAYDSSYISELLQALAAHFSGTVVLTGVGRTADESGVTVCQAGQTHCYSHRRIPRVCHGTGDVFASVFVGALLRGADALAAAKLAADFTVDCIEATADDPAHWYGVKFEPLLPRLLQKLDAVAGGAK